MSQKDNSDNNNDRNKQNDIFLKVSETDARDVGRRIARIDPKVAESFGIATGDAIEILSTNNNKRTTVLSWPAYPQDYGKGLIRIDGYTRSKLGVGIGDNVAVKKVII